MDDSFELVDPKHFPGDRVHYSGQYGAADGTVHSTSRITKTLHVYRVALDDGTTVMTGVGTLAALAVTV